MATERDTFDSSDEESQEFEKSELAINWLDLHCHGFGDDVILGISSLPGCRFKDTWRDLNKDVRRISAEGVRDVFVLVTRGELNKYRARALLDQYKLEGLKVHHHPGIDGGAFTTETLKGIVDDLKETLKQDRKTLVHCFGGLGRSCLVATALLLTLDDTLSPEDAIERMRKLRGKAAVQSVQQYNMIMEYRARVRSLNQESTEPANDIPPATEPIAAEPVSRDAISVEKAKPEAKDPVSAVVTESADRPVSR